MPAFTPSDYVDCQCCCDPYTPIKKVLFVSWGVWSGNVTWNGTLWVGEQDINMPVYVYDPYTGLCSSSGSGNVRVRIQLGCLFGVNYLTRCCYGNMTAGVYINACGDLDGGCGLVPAAGSSNMALAYTSIIGASQEGTGVDQISCKPGPVSGEMRMRGYATGTGGIPCIGQAWWDYSTLPWGGIPSDGSTACCLLSGMGATPDNLVFTE
jgi:hypothetical protein